LSILQEIEDSGFVKRLYGKYRPLIKLEDTLDVLVIASIPP